MHNIYFEEERLEAFVIAARRRRVSLHSDGQRAFGYIEHRLFGEELLDLQWNDVERRQGIYGRRVSRLKCGITRFRNTTHGRDS